MFTVMQEKKSNVNSLLFDTICTHTHTDLAIPLSLFPKRMAIQAIQAFMWLHVSVFLLDVPLLHSLDVSLKVRSHATLSMQNVF